MSSFTKLLVLSAITMLLTLPACSLFAERPIQPRLHDFGLTEQFAAPEATKPASLVTVTVTAPQWLQNENIRYRQLYADPTRVGFYTQDRWLAAPAAMLAQRLTLFNGKPGWRLKISLLEFEQVFDTQQTARMMLVFRATAQSPSRDDIAADTVFNLSMPTASADAQGAVSASALLVDKAVNALQNWLATVAD